MGGKRKRRLNQFISMKIHHWLVSCALFLSLATPVVFAQSNNVVVPQQSPLLGRLQTVGTGAGYSQTNEGGVLAIVGTVISALLGLLGIIFIILMLLAGYNWMTASGDEGKIDKAKDTLRSAIIGLIIVVGAFAIWRFIAGYLIGGQSTIVNPPTNQ